MRWVSPLVLVVLGASPAQFGSLCLAQQFKERVSLQGREGEVMSLAFSPDDKTLATGHGGKCLKLWNVASAREIATLTIKEVSEAFAVAHALRFSPDGNNLGVANHDCNCWIWNIPGAKKTASFRVKDNGIPLTFRPDLKMAASVSYERGPMGENLRRVDLWDLATGKQIAMLKGHSLSPEALSFSPDGKTLASGGNDKLIKLWDVATGKNTVTIAGHAQPIIALAFSPDGKTLASVSKDRTIKLWEASSGQLRAALRGHAGLFASVAFRPDGKTLAVGGSPDNTVAIWDLPSGQLAATLRGHTKPVLAVAFSPDGKTLASGSADTTIKLWDVSEPGKAK